MQKENKEDEEIQLVSTHCKHEDCIYRSYITYNGRVPVCLYAVFECQPRGCKISECNRYIPGKKLKAKMREDIVIYWETEVYGNTDDNSLV